MSQRPSRLVELTAEASVCSKNAPPSSRLIVSLALNLELSLSVHDSQNNTAHALVSKMTTFSLHMKKPRCCISSPHSDITRTHVRFYLLCCSCNETLTSAPQRFAVAPPFCCFTDPHPLSSTFRSSCHHLAAFRHRSACSP